MSRAVVGRALRVLVASTSGIINDGITSWIRSIFSAMDRDGLEVDVVAWEGASQDVISSVGRCVTHVHVLPSRKRDTVRYVDSLRGVARAGHYDVLHVCGSSGLMSIELGVAASSGVQMRIAHSHNTSCQYPILDRATRPIMGLLATDRLACGRDAGRWLFGRRPFTVIPNGRELSAYRFSPEKRAAARRGLGLDDGHVAIGHVGRFNRQKNHAALLEAFAVLARRSPSYRLILIGDGDLVDEVREGADRLEVGDSVAFLGRRADVPDLLNAMDCMVLPSLYEGFPSVVLEWQLNGLPCVISDAVTDECAITPLVTFESLERDGACWADAVEEALLRSDRARDSGLAVEAARSRGYDIRDNAAMLKRLYLEGAAR